MIIAVDFDGTLFENKYPDIGEPKWNVINYCKQSQAEGNKLVLWTCRTDADLAIAIEACQKVGLVFDSVNANIEERAEAYGGDSRKVSADLYIDDKCVRPEEL